MVTIKKMQYAKQLTQALLASSVFLAQGGVADTTISVPTPVPPQLSTAVQGNITIAPTGQVNSIVPATQDIWVNTPGAFVSIDPNNVSPGGQAILAANGTGVVFCDGAQCLLTGAGDGSSLTVGANSSVVSTGPGSTGAVDIYANNTTISNSGTISSAVGTITIEAVANNTTINNFLGGTIVITTPGDGGIVSKGPGLSLYNAGNINNINIQNGLTNFLNNTTGMITSLVGNDAISLTAAPVTGNIQNFGLISGGSSGININTPFTGSILNFSSGVIQSVEVNSPALLVNNSFGSINNAGTIQALAVAGDAIQVTASSAGTIINSGLIQSNVLAISLAGSVGEIDNLPTGTIQGKFAITVNNTVSLPGGINNSGNITALSAPFNAINLNSAGGTRITLTQNAGTITGNVRLPEGDSQPIHAGLQNTLIVNGGKIIGNVTGNGIPGDLFSLNGGEITGTTTLGGAGGGQVDLAGTKLNILIGTPFADTFNITGGSFVSLDGGGLADIMYVKASFTAGLIDNVEIINVQNAGTVFTAAQPITNMNTSLNIFAGASTVFTASSPALGIGDINNFGTLQLARNINVVTTGDITNNGTIVVNGGGTLEGGKYLQNAGSAYSPEIQSPGTPGVSGNIKATTSADLKATSTVNPFLSGQFIPAGSFFDIVHAPLGTITDNSTLVQPPSLTVFFDKATVVCPGGSCVRLTTLRNAFGVQGDSDIAIAVGATLDGIAASPVIQSDLLALLGQLDLINNRATLTTALESLAPPFNYAIVGASQVSMDAAFFSAHMRLEDIKRMRKSLPVAVKTVRDRDFYNAVDVDEGEHRDNYDRGHGRNYGDIDLTFRDNGYASVWAKLFGTGIIQNKRNNIEGYTADAIGFAIGGDAWLNDYAAVGAALSYSAENTTDKSEARNSVDSFSPQITFYGWFEPINCDYEFFNKIYLDAMFAVASHRYDTTRRILVNNLGGVATAAFYGLHYGVQVDMGFPFESADEYLVAPFARFKMTYLSLDKYTETGANGLNLSVTNQPVSELVLGSGLRLGFRRDYVEAVCVQEFTAAILYDFSAQAQEMTANFLGGGNPFYISSIIPAQVIYQLGAGINAHNTDGYSFSLRGNFEYRDHYYAFNAYMQLRYTWA